MIQSSSLKEMNLFLKGLNGKNSPLTIFVDNLHSPYILLNAEYILPAISNTDLTENDIYPYLQILSNFIPEAIETDRIYFSTRIIPIKNVIRADGEIIDFEVQTFDKGLFFSETEAVNTDRPRNYSELFDEIDYSHIMEPIKQSLKISQPHWTLGKIYEPVYIEYLTLAIRFLSVSYEKVLSHFSHFYEILEIIHGDGAISEITKRNFVFWLSKHSFERGTSPSGNMRWKILN